MESWTLRCQCWPTSKNLHQFYEDTVCTQEWRMEGMGGDWESGRSLLSAQIDTDDDDLEQNNIQNIRFNSKRKCSTILL